MGLRAKLFFWIGSLFLLTAISSYLLPRLFIQEDVIGLKEMFDIEVQKERSSQQETRRKLFTDRVIQNISSFNGTLLYVDKTPLVRQYLNPSTDFEEKTIWQELSTLISYNPEIGFASVQNNELNLSLVVDNPKIYSSQAIKLTENCNLVIIKTSENIIPQVTFGPYLAIYFEEAPKESLIPSSSFFSTSLQEQSSSN